MVLNRTEPARNKGSIPDMYKGVEYAHQDLEADDGMKWEEFFGASVDITSALLDMFDTLVAKNNVHNDDYPSAPQSQQQQSQSAGVRSTIPCDPGGIDSGQQLKKHPHNLRGANGVGIPGRRPVRTYSKRSYSDSAFQEKKRPLSTSSVSSSSSSSSSSLPRNGLDVKKSYLASIESLDDDDHFSEDGGGGVVSRDRVTLASRDRDAGLSGCSGGVVAQPLSKPRWCDPNLSHTDRVVLEIIDTEKTYVRDLNEIIQGYLKHISHNTEDVKVSEQYLEELFSNIEDIYKFNSLFVEELEHYGLDPVAIARCFVKNSSGFEVYTQYCTNYPRTVSVLTELMGNSETAEIFKERQMALQHSLPLGSYLLKPVQRILKYHLLLQNMVKHSDKESEGYADIKNALSVMTGIAYHINDMKRKHEHAVRVQEIQSLLYGWEGQDLTTYGELVAEGAFRMFRAKALRHLFLFDKMLLIAKKKEEGILSYKTHIMCSNLMLIESIQGEPLCFHVIPFDNPRYQYTFQARNVEQKREWCLQLKQVILENYNAVIPSHARQLVLELGQSKQEDAPLEKSTTKRQLSAPEYLEKRKQERRKSEISLNRAFKLKKGTKKNEHILNNKDTMVNGRRKSPPLMANSHTSTYSREEWTNQKDNSAVHSAWKKSQDEMNRSQQGQNAGCLTSSKESLSDIPATSGVSALSIMNRESRLRHSLPEPSLPHRTMNRERRFRPSWRAWNSVPEETTDTENEDVNDRSNSQRLLELRSTSRPFRNRPQKEPSDPTGEYVTFFFAHAYACRDMLAEDSADSRLNVNDLEESEPDAQIDDDDASSSASNASPSKKYSSRKYKDQNKVKKTNSKQDLSDNLMGMWTKLKTSHFKDRDSESGSSTCSWKQSAAVRRVQSFTGMAKAKVASLQHTLSFRHHSGSCSEPKSGAKRPTGLPLCGALPLPMSGEDISPTTPAAWLKQQEEHFANGAKKSGSLPRSFQITQEPIEKSDTSSDNNSQSHSENSSVHRMRIRDGQRCLHTEQRPFTIASDKPSQADFMDDLDKFMEHSPNGCSNYNFRKEFYEHDTTTGCTNTPAVSLENVHAIHPEHKIYHQAASKYSTLKHVFSNMGSKLAGLRATLSSPLSHDQTDSCSNISIDSEQSKYGIGRSSSRSSIRNEKDISPKILTARFVHSVAKAYSTVMKHRLKKSELKYLESSQEGRQEKSPVHAYKSESSVIGARMAHPLESEYSVPKNCLLSRQTKNFKDDVRPDSLLSESSNATSSSDGDKTNILESSVHLPLSMKQDDMDDTTSDASESSADSYYERTFEAIETALAEDMFRDSAIYSDPEDADFSTVESTTGVTKTNSDTKRNTHQFQSSEIRNMSFTSPQLGLMCKRRVNQAIIERLRILEENVKFQREDSLPNADNVKSVTQKRLDLEKWCSQGNRDYEESETSSEHSASTVNTVMESGNKVSKPMGKSGNSRNQPRIKGWVKHVVEKLQGEGQV